MSRCSVTGSEVVSVEDMREIMGSATQGHKMKAGSGLRVQGFVEEREWVGAKFFLFPESRGVSAAVRGLAWRGNVAAETVVS